MWCPAICSASQISWHMSFPRQRLQHTAPCAFCTTRRLPAGTQQPLRDYRLHVVAGQTQKELAPRCQSVTFSPGPLSGNEKQPKLDHTYNHSITGQHGYCPNGIQCQQLLWQDGLKSTRQLDLRRMDNPMVCLKHYRRHRLNVNQKEKSTDHQHINGLSLAFSAHYCLV